MSAIDVAERILTRSIINADLKYCFVSADKLPFRFDGNFAKPNCKEDFVNFNQLIEGKIMDFAGIGVSIQASNLCAIDVDHCFSKVNDVESGDERANYFLNLFKDVAYCEFSFSGTGLRILFRHELIDNYSDKYYIKNSNYGIEYYQPTNSFRYVTITGNSIYDNNIDSNINFKDKIISFLDKYMKRNVTEIQSKAPSVENRSFEELYKLTKTFYKKDASFQDLWFTKAPGSGKDESERDYHLLSYLYENVTQDKELIKKIFEQSEFFKTKDTKHVYKWKNQNYRYFNYIYEIISKCAIPDNPHLNKN